MEIFLLLHLTKFKYGPVAVCNNYIFRVWGVFGPMYGYFLMEIFLLLHLTKFKYGPVQVCNNYIFRVCGVCSGLCMALFFFY